MSSTPIRVDVLTRVSPRLRITRDLALRDSTPEAELTFELVRAVAWASTQGRIPVAGHVLADRATQALAPVSQGPPTGLRATVEAAVEGLESVGDLANLGGGQWICAPTHFITTPASQPNLLISGLPLRALEQALRRQLVPHGPSRRLVTAAAGLPEVSFSTWTRRPQEPLRTWTQRILDSVELHGAAPSAVRALQPAFYHPGPTAENRPQAKRWRPPSSDLNGRQLARTTSLTGSVEYQICELHRGRLVGSRPCDSDTARRLMYGIDAVAGNPTRARIRGSKKEVTIQTTNPLPRSEARSLIAVAHSARTREWIMPVGYPLNCPVLDGLGIAIITE